MINNNLFLTKNPLTFLFILFCVSGFSQDLNSNLLIHYPFDGNSNDASGNGHNGQDFGVTYTVDRFGNPNSACNFNGIDNYVNFPNLTILKPNLPVSFSFWIKYDSNSFQNQVVFNTSFEENRSSSVVFNSQSGSNKYVINYADGTYFYSPATRRSYISNSVIDTNDWHNIVVVVNGSNDMKIIVDCVETNGVYSGTGGDLAYSTQPGCLGRHDRSLTLPPDYFKGSIDEFRYWNRALTEADIALLCGGQVVLNNNEFSSNNLIVYPNPSKSTLFVNSTLVDIKYITIVDSLGQEVYQSSFVPSIDISKLSEGIYFLKASNGEFSITQKIIKEK